MQSSNLQPRCRPVRLLTYFSLSHSKSKAVKYQTQKKSQMSCCFEKMLNMAMYLLGIVCLGFALFHLHSLWAVTWHWLLSGWPSGVLSVEHSLVVGSVSDKANQKVCCLNQILEKTFCLQCIAQQSFSWSDTWELALWHYRSQAHTLFPLYCYTTCCVDLAASKC